MRPAVVDESDGVTVTVRPLLGRATTADGVGIAMRWQQTVPRETQRAAIDLDALALEVTTGDDAPVSLRVQPIGREEIDATPWFGKTDLDHVFLLRATPRGLLGQSWMRAWRDEDREAAALLARPGRLRVRLRGHLIVGAGRVPFRTPELPFELVAPSPSFRTQVDLDQLARRALASQVIEVESRGLLAMDDTADNRWLFFNHYRAGDDAQAHVLISPAGRVLGVRYRSHDPCLAAGTQVSVPGGAIAIEELAVGDEVLAYDEARGITTARVEATAMTGVRPVLDIDGLLVTPNHPVLVDGTWQPAGTIEMGSRLRARHGWVAVQAVEERGLRPVYDVRVSEPHTLLADGRVVHNKSVPRAMSMSLWEWWLGRPPEWAPRKK